MNPRGYWIAGLQYCDSQTLVIGLRNDSGIRKCSNTRTELDDQLWGCDLWFLSEREGRTCSPVSAEGRPVRALHSCHESRVILGTASATRNATAK